MALGAQALETELELAKSMALLAWASVLVVILMAEDLVMAMAYWLVLLLLQRNLVSCAELAMILWDPCLLVDNHRVGFAD